MTRKWGRNVAHTLEGNTPFRSHLDFWGQHSPDWTSVDYFEFGVGRDLFSNLLAFCLGARKQLAVDLHPYARRELINDIIRQLQNIQHPLFVRRPPAFVGKDLAGDLARFYGIDYRAPCNLLSLLPEEGPFQVLASTSVMEHIYENEVAPVLAHCGRLSQMGTLFSLEIDYSDHYSHRDRSITPYNFLQFSDSQWQKLYMPHYYTNRFRHRDYRGFILQSGFEILHERTTVPPNAKAMLGSITPSDRFRSYTPEELMITQGVFFAKKL